MTPCRCENEVVRPTTLGPLRSLVLVCEGSDTPVPRGVGGLLFPYWSRLRQRPTDIDVGLRVGGCVVESPRNSRMTLVDKGREWTRELTCRGRRGGGVVDGRGVAGLTYPVTTVVFNKLKILNLLFTI